MKHLSTNYVYIEMSVMFDSVYIYQVFQFCDLFPQKHSHPSRRVCSYIYILSWDCKNTRITLLRFIRWIENRFYPFHHSKIVIFIFCLSHTYTHAHAFHWNTKHIKNSTNIYLHFHSFYLSKKKNWNFFLSIQ